MKSSTKILKGKEVLGIGVDIENNKRFFLDRDKHKHFLNKIYTDRELDYCYSKAVPAQHLAARFCAKEAVLKALSKASSQISHNEIEIVNESNGKPVVIIHNDKNNESQILISISHCKEKSVAFAVLKDKRAAGKENGDF